MILEGGNFSPPVQAGCQQREGSMSACSLLQNASQRRESGCQTQQFRRLYANANYPCIRPSKIAQQGKFAVRTQNIGRNK